MPVQYSTIVQEHETVRNRVGLFDISHMGRIVFSGPDVLPWLQRVTTNDVAALEPGKIQYSLVANASGGLIDDILVYRGGDGDYSIVCNASNRLAVLDQLKAHAPAGGATQLLDWTLATTMIAIQGPKAEKVLQSLCDVPLANIGYYHVTTGNVLKAKCTISRTGYTGEDGFEISFAEEMAVFIWEALMNAGQSEGIEPCGLGARDTLRFEAAMPLYGHELDSTTDPYASGVGWAVKLKKGDFVGRDALVQFKANSLRQRVGLELEGKRIARQGAEVLAGDSPIGTVTSGTYSPTLGKSLAMAIIDRASSAIGTELTIDVRGHREPARVVKLPFYSRPVSSSGTSL